MIDEVTLEQLLEEPTTKADNQVPEPAQEVDNLGKDKPVTPSKPDDAVKEPIVAGSPYTVEELQSIPIERLDPARVPDQARPYYEAGLREKKGLQAEFTRKSQELAAFKSGGQPRNLEEAFDNDPVGVLSRIGQEIDARELQLAGIDQFADPESAKSLRTEIARLNILNRQLNQRGIALQRNQEQGNSIVMDTMSEVRTVIKDYDSKRPALEKFAIEDLGYTEQEIGVMTDPRLVGKSMAIKNFKAVNALFDKSQAIKSAEKKILKAKPNQLEKDTATFGKSKEEPESYDELDNHLTKLKL